MAEGPGPKELEADRRLETKELVAENLKARAAAAKRSAASQAEKAVGLRPGRRGDSESLAPRAAAPGRHDPGR